MRLPYQLTDSAKADLYTIWEYIAAASAESADRQITAIVERFATLAGHPRSGRVRGELGKGMRSVVQGSYVILYRIEPETVQIVRVVHGARDVASLLDDQS
ncbi:MAG: type II toxin-antitoxin system RelE/ParE family toxin [Phycisphaerae bacterium]|nr:type II toxin-antitoxin system RelE/ParE family toxin [Phycisphaerae bacterium]